MNSEVGGRGSELTKPLLEEIQTLDHRDKKKGREAPVKRGMTTVSAGGFFEPWLGRTRFVNTQYPVSGLCHSSERSAQRPQSSRGYRGEGTEAL